jgi:hypothetical protein
MNNNEIQFFSFYLDSLNIKMNENVLVLTSHYYYDINEIQHIKAVIYTKELNKVSNINKLLSNMMRTLSNGTQFIGCFVDNKLHYNSKIGYWLYHFVDMNNSKYLSRKTMIKLFDKYGLRIVDMTEVQGMTYFSVKRY